MAIFHSIRGRSSASPSAAISEAMGEAVSDFGKDAKSVHVLIASISQVGDEWVAIVRVVVEPDLDEESELKHELIHKHEGEQDRKREEEFKEEREGMRKREEDLREQAHVDLPEPESDHAPYLYAYMSSEHEEFYKALPKQLEESSHFYPHLIEEGALWNEVEEGFFPHADFYEATHQEQLAHWHEFHDTLRDLNQKYEKKHKPALMELTQDAA